MICRYKIKFISDIEQKIRKLLVNIAVAPFVGVWIEIISSTLCSSDLIVAPFVGVWIEIKSGLTRTEQDRESLPSWECGLKCGGDKAYIFKSFNVAPFVGVWIEIRGVLDAVSYTHLTLPTIRLV